MSNNKAEISSIISMRSSTRRWRQIAPDGKANNLLVKVCILLVGIIFCHFEVATYVEAFNNANGILKQNNVAHTGGNSNCALSSNLFSNIHGEQTRQLPLISNFSPTQYQGLRRKSYSFQKSTTTRSSSSSTALCAVGGVGGTSGNAIVDALLGTLGSPFQSICVLSFVVFVHEAGHFLAARYYNIKVQEFSVGVGPKLFGFTPGVGKLNEGIEFNLRAIPLGGYVRFPENYNQTLVSQMEKEIYDAKKEQKEQLKQQKQATKESAPSISYKSPTFTMISKMFGSEKQGKKEMTTSPITTRSSNKTTTAASFSFSSLFKKKDSADVTMKAKKSTLSNNNAMKDDDYEIEIDYYDDPNLLQNRSWFQRGVVLSGGILFNLLLAFTIYFGEATIGGGLPTPTFDTGCLVSANPKPESASYGILKKGDVIIGINGENLSLVRKSSPLESQQQVSDLISKIRLTHVGEDIELKILDKASSSTKDVTVTSKPLSKSDPSSPSSIGVMLSPNLLKMEKVKSASVVEAASSASGAVYDLTSDTIKSIYGAIGTMLKTVVGKGASTGSAMQLSGPIGVIKMGSEVVQTKDFQAVAMFAAAISINLAVVNSLPIPALDGGQLVFVLGEALTGKKIDQRKQEEINALAVLVLLLVTFSTTVGDLSK